MANKVSISPREVKIELMEGRSELLNQFFDSITEQAALTTDQETQIANYLSGSIEKRDQIANFIESAESEAELCRKRELSIAARRHAWEQLARMLRDGIKTQLELMGVKSVAGAEREFKITKNPPSVSITNAEEVPAQFLNYVPTPDKNAIKEALQKGAAVPGAELIQNATRLTIR